jgi:predicted porin
MVSGSVRNTYVDRPRNAAIKYASPSLGGLTAAVVYGLDENATLSSATLLITWHTVLAPLT